jgi:uncharacterized membrane protein YfhO
MVRNAFFFIVGFIVSVIAVAVVERVITIAVWDTIRVCRANVIVGTILTLPVHIYKWPKAEVHQLAFLYVVLVILLCGLGQRGD